ncbi:MAG: hypothetical protein CVV13_11595 [Gammaproteobacteria bacterium HGW-Gammaproteobacteria-3]|nr:MAG: hypothetical protein CVV13_11595 [Gammaproteobacteria bacterium HGW-Gammaproteobacteria-3]
MKHPYTKAQLSSGALSLLITGVILTQPVLAEDTNRILELERKLERSLQAVERLTQRVQELETVDNTHNSAASAAKNQASDDLTRKLAEHEERLAGVENTVFEIDDKVGSRTIVSAFDAMELTLGGFLDTSYTVADGEDGTSASFNRQWLGLLIGVKLNESWSAFLGQAFVRKSEVEYDDPGRRRDPTFDRQSESRLMLAWANYHYSDELNIRVGRFVTPHGIINIEHFPAVLLSPEQPLFLRTPLFEQDIIFSNFTDGAQFHGQTSFGFGNTGKFQYTAYVGNNELSSTKHIYGTRLAYTFGESGFTLGGNFSKGERRNEPAAPGTPNNLGQNYTVLGVDALYDKGSFLVKSEYYKTMEDNGARNREAYYIQPAWRITPQWTAFYRYDFLDDGNNFGDVEEHVAGLNYLPYTNIRLRAFYTRRLFESGGGFGSADANIYQLSGTFSF